MDKTEYQQRGQLEAKFNRHQIQFIHVLMDELAELKGQTPVDFIAKFNEKVDEKINNSTTRH